ncbi:MAG: hypothetical protein IT371_16370 [Deltaproteobacteria bacterium]|nr:hypothetical protein [Deltaproteobacteria bacterium]
MFSHARVRRASQEESPSGLKSELEALDRLLPGQGLPRGRLSELSGPWSSGKRSLAAAWCGAALGRGELAIWVDALGGFYPLPALEGGAPFEALVVVRPPRVTRQRELPGLRAADLLLGGGCSIALLVLDVPVSRGVQPRQLSRLQHGAERSGAAVLFVTEKAAGAASLGTQVSLHLAVERREGWRLQVALCKSKLGPTERTARVELHDPHGLHLDPTL